MKERYARMAVAAIFFLYVLYIRVYDIDPAATSKLLDNLAGTDGLRLTVCHSTREAVQGADIVTTITAAPGTRATSRLKSTNSSSMRCMWRLRGR